MRHCEQMAATQKKYLPKFAKTGIDADALADQLQDEGAKSFVKSWAAKSAALKKAS